MRQCARWRIGKLDIRNESDPVAATLTKLKRYDTNPRRRYQALTCSGDQRVRWHLHQKGKGKALAEARANEKKIEKNPTEAGEMIATIKECGGSRGQKRGLVNGWTEDSSGSCRSNTQRKNNPNTDWHRCLTSDILDSGNKQENQRHPRWETTKEKRGK